jgi:hypothetical protein
MFPDLMDAMKQLKVESIVIDSEVIGFDYEKQSTYLSMILCNVDVSMM